MKKIHSKLSDDVLLAVLNRREDCNKKRKNLSEDKEVMQVSAKNLSPDDKFKPHKHSKIKRVTDVTQEAWVIISGRIKAKIWDLDDTLAYETEMSSGDCLVAFYGGHCFEVLESDTVLYEFKNGPYYGVDKDKTDIRG